jgi:outer membrane protein OmpA-like peptidoglycan-associated protein
LNNLWHRITRTSLRSGSFALVALALASSEAQAQTAPAPAADTSTPAAPAEAPSHVALAGTAVGGAVGLWRITSAEAGDVGSLRLTLRLGLFQQSNFPTVGTDRLLTGDLELGYTFYKGMEVYGSYQNSSNSNTVSVPHVVQAEGDVTVGLKVGGLLGPITLAGDLRFDLKNGLGDDYPTPQSSDIALRILAGYAIKGFHADLNFGGIIGRNTLALNPLVNGEQAALLFGAGLSGYFQLDTGLMLRYDIPVVKQYVIAPFFGMDFDIPLGVSAANLSAAKASLADVTAKRFAVGARFGLGRGGAIDFAVVGGAGTEVLGWARTEPWMLTLAYSFAFDPNLYNPPPPPPPPPPPKPTTAALHGSVFDNASGAPVAGAVIAPTDSLPVAASVDGSFVTRELKYGHAQLHVEREGYKSADVDVTVAPGAAAVVVKLDALPPPAPVAPVVQQPPAPVVPAAPPMGFITGALLKQDGTGLPAVVKITGTLSNEVHTGADGSFTVKLPAGPYEIVLIADGFFARAASVTVGTDQATTVILKTSPTPKAPAAKLEGDKITLTKPFALDEKRVTPTPAETNALAEVADFLIRNPDKKLVINVHSDQPRGSTGDRIDWTQARADAIRDALVSQGAPLDRLEAHGLGTTQPLVPLESRQQKQNRRVEMSLQPLPPKHILSIHPVAPAAEPAPEPPPPPPR